jgi:hypothetical protein
MHVLCKLCVPTSCGEQASSRSSAFTTSSVSQLQEYTGLGVQLASVGMMNALEIVYSSSTIALRRLFVIGVTVTGALLIWKSHIPFMLPSPDLFLCPFLRLCLCNAC